MESGLKKDLESKQIQLKDLTSLISQKEENGNEIEYNLNQIKAEVINLRTDKEIYQNKSKKTIEELQNKISKERQNFQLIEAQANERVKIYD